MTAAHAEGTEHRRNGIDNIAGSSHVSSSPAQDDPALRPEPVLSHPDGRLLRAGRPHRVLAGSLHYFRVHPDQWADRLRRVAAMGLNTVDTYVPWNFHEPRPGRYRFTGAHDVERFVRT